MCEYLAWFDLLRMRRCCKALCHSQTLLSHVEELSVGPIHEPEEPPTYDEVDSLQCLLLSLPRLKHLTMRHDKWRTPEVPGLPHLESLSLYLPDDLSSLVGTHALLNASLRHRLDPVHAQPALEACPNLRSLTVEGGACGIEVYQCVSR